MALNTYVVPRDGWQWCHLCEQWMTEAHIDSKYHIERVEEMSAITEMIGTCSSARRFSRTLGFQGLLTKSTFRTFWGSDVERMPQIVWQRLREGTQIRVSMPHWGNKSKEVLSIEDVKEIDFATVS